MEKPQSKTVLVVEDEPDVLMFIEATLEDAGYNVITAANGHEAYNRVKEQQPDFITLDLVMPKQSGALFYLKLCNNRHWCDIPVMIISAHAHDDLGEDDFKRLMRGKDVPRPAFFMEKPVAPRALVSIVGKALGVDVTQSETDASARDELFHKLKSADLETLGKIKSLLDRGED
jgi:CheY-like chemotaxis protein